MNIVDTLAGTANGLARAGMITIKVSLDEALNKLEEILKDVDAEDVIEIEKVVKGSFWTAFKVYDTKNGKYRITTLYALTARSSRTMNKISIMNLEEGKEYVYKVFLFKGRFKKPAVELVRRYKK